MTHTALRALLAKASQAPWRFENDEHGLPEQLFAADVCIDGTDDLLVANMSLIVAAVNSLGPHLDRIEKLEAALRALVFPAGFTAETSHWDRARELLKGTHACRGCGLPLMSEHERTTADGCPCNSRLGINHGLVPKHTCTCIECDPEQTGSVRYPTEAP